MAGFRGWVRQLEDAWFDATRNVQTSGESGKPAAGGFIGEPGDSKIYAPVRAANARAAVASLPIGNPSDYTFRDYTFIDMGSGKGRMLFIAAELPFRQVVGVEFDAALHACALDNIARCRKRWMRCPIAAVHANAAEYPFPAGPLVIYMFNPFGPEILARMLDNLHQSLVQEPRHVVILMLWPEHEDVVAQRPWLQESARTPRYVIFETRSN